jgi:TPR repeat protein
MLCCVVFLQQMERTHGIELAPARSPTSCCGPIRRFNLGVYYRNGCGVPQDNSESVRWFKLAAATNHAEAQCELGTAYKLGLGVQQDVKEAMRLYTLSADQGCGDACYNLAVMLREALPRFPGSNMETAQVAGMVPYYFKRAAEAGVLNANHNVGMCYQEGYGCDMDMSMAVKWFRRGAERGDTKAMLNLGIILMQGVMVESDPQEAELWFARAAAKGDAHAASLITMVRRMKKK